MGKELQEAASARFKNGQTFISQTWGLSENTGSATLNNFGEVDLTGSVSRLLPNMRLRYVLFADHRKHWLAQWSFYLVLARS